MMASFFDFHADLPREQLLQQTALLFLQRIQFFLQRTLWVDPLLEPSAWFEP